MILEKFLIVKLKFVFFRNFFFIFYYVFYDVIDLLLIVVGEKVIVCKGVYNVIY